MINDYVFCVELQELDLSGRIAVNKLIMSILTTAGIDAQRNGFGVDSLNSNNTTWVLSRLAIELVARPKVAQEYTVSTWVADFTKILSTRNFELTACTGEAIGAAVSQWCVIDTQKRTLVDLNTIGDRSDVIEHRASPIAPPARISRLTPTQSSEHRVGYCDIDFNGHMNTLRYVELMLDVLPIELLKGDSALRFDLQFMHEALHGELLTLDYEAKEGEHLFEIKKQCGTTAVKAVIKRALR